MKLIDYTNKTEKEILEKAKELLGLTINEILSYVEIDLNVKDKGKIGKIIEEYWFGMKPNNNPVPDFEKSKIELKIIPLSRNAKNELRVKERTKVCSIDYKKLVGEKWDTSHAKLKLNKILFIYYEYSKDIKNSLVHKIDLWELKGIDEILIKEDWKKVYSLVFEGKAHELSESISKILAASRHGSGGKNPDGTLRDLVQQPNNPFEMALKRAFSLKSSFTNQRWIELNNGKYESIIETLELKSLDFEESVLEKLRTIENLSLGEIGRIYNIDTPNGKNAPATIVKKVLGFKNVNSRIKEFEKYGIQVKTIPIRLTDYKPWEAISFPTFKFKELIEEKFYSGEKDGEEWDDCSLLKEINRILFIPIIRDKRESVSIEEKIIGKSFFWSPSNKELEIIEKEWENYIQEIKDGKVEVDIIQTKNGYKEVSKLSKESDTQIIHIRPHAKDRTDRDEDHLGNSIVKQSFWLNKGFLKELVKKVYEE